MEVRAVHHVAMAVEDLDAAVATYERLFGARVELRGRMEDQGSRPPTCGLEVDVELVSPLGADTPVGRFLAKRGPGMHHVAFEVADVASAVGSRRRRGDRRRAARRSRRP